MSHLHRSPCSRALCQANAIFELQVKNKAGKEETWTIDLKKEGKVYHGKAKPKADITIIISDDHLIELAYGSVSTIHAMWKRMC